MLVVLLLKKKLLIIAYGEMYQDRIIAILSKEVTEEPLCEEKSQITKRLVECWCQCDKCCKWLSFLAVASPWHFSNSLPGRKPYYVYLQLDSLIRTGAVSMQSRVNLGCSSQNISKQPSWKLLWRQTRKDNTCVHDCCLNDHGTFQNVSQEYTQENVNIGALFRCLLKMRFSSTLQLTMFKGCHKNTKVVNQRVYTNMDYNGDEVT